MKVDWGLSMAVRSRRGRVFDGCHPEANPKSSSPGALPGWQPPELPDAARHYLLLYHQARLHYYQHLRRAAQGASGSGAAMGPTRDQA